MVGRWIAVVGMTLSLAFWPSDGITRQPDAFGEYIVVIARWDGPEAQEITVQDFISDGESYIPIFSDAATFRRETAGSGYEDQGIEIRLDLFASMLRGDEVLVLNPASDNRRLTPADIRALAERD